MVLTIVSKYQYSNLLVLITCVCTCKKDFKLIIIVCKKKSELNFSSIKCMLLSCLYSVVREYVDK